MSDLDGFDDDLGDALRARSANVHIGTAAAHERVLHRASVVRRRRAAMAGTGVAALAVVGVLALPRGGERQIGTADSTAAPTSTVVSWSSTATPTTAASIPAPSTVAPATSVDDDRAPGSTPVDDGPSTTARPSSTVASPGPTSVASSTLPGASTTAVPPTAAPTTAAPSTSASTTAASPSTSTTATSTTLDHDAVAPFTETYPSSGGSITVTWNGSSLSLTAATPAPGHVAEVEDSGNTRVRVRFSGPEESRIEVRVEGGEVRVDID
jgi:hypothetical protein